MRGQNCTNCIHGEAPPPKGLWDCRRLEKTIEDVLLENCPCEGKYYRSLTEARRTYKEFWLGLFREHWSYYGCGHEQRPLSKVLTRNIIECSDRTLSVFISEGGWEE